MSINHTKIAKISDLKQITSQIDEFRDAFYHVAKGVKYTGAATEKIELHRPFAQVNVATSDLEEFTELGGKLVTSQIKVTDVANTFEMFDDKASYSGEEGKDVVTFEAAEVPGEKLKNVNGKEYDYLAMAYVLFPGDAEPESSSTTTISVVVTEENNTTVELGYEGATVKRNHRTNLVGSFLTSSAEFDIVVDENFDNDYNYDETDLKNILTNGGKFVLNEDLLLEDGTHYLVTGDVIIDLNGNSITGDCGAETGKYSALLSVQNGATLIIRDSKGTGKVVNTGDNYPVEVRNGQLEIYGGYFEGNTTAVYGHTGTIKIYGGQFAVNKDHSEFEKYRYTYLLNLYGQSKAEINVYGGSFVGFNPSDNKAENPAVNFVADGYKVIESDGKWYVVPETVDDVVSTTDELKEALTNGATDILIPQDMKLAANSLKGASNDLTLNLAAGTTVTVDSGVTTGSTGAEKNLTFTGDKSSTVVFQNTNSGYEGPLAYLDGVNLNVEGITFNAEQISGICARGGEVTFENCHITGELEKTIASRFEFIGCTFDVGVTQVGYGCTDVVFEGCTFETDGYGIKIYREGSGNVNLTVKDCSFKNTGSKARSAIFLDHIVDNITYNITIENCKFEGYTAIPTATDNTWAARMIVSDSFIQTTDNQYIFSYQTGAEGGSFHKILTKEQLVVTVK